MDNGTFKYYCLELFNIDHYKHFTYSKKNSILTMKKTISVILLTLEGHIQAFSFQILQNWSFTVCLLL